MKTYTILYLLITVKILHQKHVHRRKIISWLYKIKIF